MDAIATEAGVSKLTVYSHFKDKETLFFQAIRARCEEQMPETLFDMDVAGPLPGQLEAIARAFFALVTAPDALALHRLLVARSGASDRLVDLFLEAGPQVVLADFEEFLQRHIRAGRLEIADAARAAQQFLSLIKGELHARMLCGSCRPVLQEEIDAHVRATVDFFLRAYGRRTPPTD